MRDYVAIRKVGLLIAAMIVMVDYTTKEVILGYSYALPLSVIDGWFAFVLAWNTGMSFSMLADVGPWGPWFLGTVAVVASAWFVHWLGESKAWGHQVGLGMIIGGAIGNLLDRIQHGAVVDFLLVYRGDWAFPAFNVADSAISVGVVLLLAHALWYKRF